MRQFINITILVNCPAINLENGQTSYNSSPETNGGYSQRTVATLMCNHAYYLSTVTNSSTCETSGNWNQDAMCLPGKHKEVYGYSIDYLSLNYSQNYTLLKGRDVSQMTTTICTWKLSHYCFSDF